MKLYIYNYILKDIDTTLYDANVSFLKVKTKNEYIYIITEQELFLLRFINISLSNDFIDLLSLKNSLKLKEIAGESHLIKMKLGEEKMFIEFKKILENFK